MFQVCKEWVTRLADKNSSLTVGEDVPVKYLSKEELIPYLQDFLSQLKSLYAHVQGAHLSDIGQALQITTAVFEEFTAYVAARGSYINCPISPIYGLPSVGSFLADLNSHFRSEDSRRRFDEKISQLTQEDATITFFENRRRFVINFGKKEISLVYRPAEKEIELEVGR